MFHYVVKIAYIDHVRMAMVAEAFTEGRRAHALYGDLACRIDICHNEGVCVRERCQKLIEKSFCPGITMRLEDYDDFILPHLFCGPQGLPDFRRVVAVI